MLFNSFSFIFLFLPLSVAGVWILWRRKAFRWIPGWLIAVSLVFYADFRLWHLGVLGGLLFFNYAMAHRIVDSRDARRWLFVAAIVDLGVLGWFKYGSLLEAWGVPAAWLPRTLPLGISFYTFQMIAYLVDLYRRKARKLSAEEFVLFILFFPQLIAGPIVHYAELVPQLRGLAEGKREFCRFWKEGVLFFSAGLLKKVLLADGFARFADRAFEDLSTGTLHQMDAWLGILAYSFQIYFDFCAYSEMAIGLGLIFGIRLPVNFFSPYKSVDFRDFWRRWHITLSTFLRDYLYIPLGGNRRGRLRTAGNVILVMTLAGAWHGSGLTFVLWGLGHGVFIVLSHLIRTFVSFGVWWSRWLGRGMTFIAVTLMWVMFRSPSLPESMEYYRVLFRGTDAGGGSEHGWEWLLIHWQNAGWIWVLAGVAIVWGLPNLIEMLRYRPEDNRSAFVPGFFGGLIAGSMLWIAWKIMGATPEHSFIYYMF